MKDNVRFYNEVYNDDRMLVYYICRCDIPANDSESIKIFHEDPNAGDSWCVITYINTLDYKVLRFDLFETYELAQECVARMTPLTPLISKRGHFDRSQSFEDFEEWKLGNNLKNYSPKLDKPCEYINRIDWSEIPPKHHFAAHLPLKHSFDFYDDLSISDLEIRLEDEVNKAVSSGRIVDDICSKIIYFGDKVPQELIKKIFMYRDKGCCGQYANFHIEELNNLHNSPFNNLKNRHPEIRLEQLLYIGYTPNSSEIFPAIISFLEKNNVSDIEDVHLLYKTLQPGTLEFHLLFEECLKKLTHHVIRKFLKMIKFFKNFLKDELYAEIESMRNHLGGQYQLFRELYT